MHNVYKVVTLPEKKNLAVLLLKYLFTCDHFVKVCIKRVKLKLNFIIVLISAKSESMFILYRIKVTKLSFWNQI